MKFAVIGAGAVGCYYGGRLAARGTDVSFVVRTPQLEPTRQNGIRIESPLGDAAVHPAAVTDDPATVGPVDAVLLGVKQFDLEGAGRQLTPMLGPETAILCMQNGVEALDRLAPIVETGFILGAIVYGFTQLVAPGHVCHLGQIARLVFGGRVAAANARAREMANTFVAAGIDVAVSDNIDRELWTKLMVVAPVGALACLRRSPIGPILIDPEDRALLRDGMAEIAEVAAVRGIALDSEAVDRSLAILDSMDANSVPSMLQDLKKGRPLELEWWSGAVVRLGAERDVETPFHRMAYDKLKPLAAGEPVAH